jgi:hypothetical protein
MFAIIDLALLLGLLALIFYVLIALAVLPTSLVGLSYILLVISIVLLCIWILFRFFAECSGGSYNWRRRNNNSVMA